LPFGFPGDYGTNLSFVLLKKFLPLEILK